MLHEEQNVKKKTTNKMKLIPLTQDKFAIVDDDDYDFLMQWKWHLHGGKNSWYAAIAYNKKAIEIFGQHANLNKV